MTVSYPTVRPDQYFDFRYGQALPRALQSRRASIGTGVVGGTLTTFQENVARFVDGGLLVEPSAINLVLNSATLATQSITVVNSSRYALTFYGTGTVEVTGAATATVVGTAADERTVYLFVPSGTSVTLTPSGSVTQAQLEKNDWATSYIETAGTEVTRAPDIVTATPEIAGDEVTVICYPYGTTTYSRPTEIKLLPSSPIPVQRAVFYDGVMDLAELRGQADNKDEFWYFRIRHHYANIGRCLGNTGVTMDVDWGDGSPIETFAFNTATGNHSFGGYGVYDVGVRLNAVDPTDYIEMQLSPYNTYVAVGPPPPTMRVGNVSNKAALSSSNLQAIDDGFGVYTGQLASGGDNTMRLTFSPNAKLTKFPLINVAEAASLNETWQNCTGLVSFPLIDTSNATVLTGTWENCQNLESFPLIDTSNVTNFTRAWGRTNTAAKPLTKLTSFPAIDTSSGENFTYTWWECTGLISFPALDFSSATNLQGTWRDCSGLTDFPFIDTSLVENMGLTWGSCTGLLTFPGMSSSGEAMLDTGSVTNMNSTWQGCSNMAGTFPQIDTSSVLTMNGTWQGCSSIADPFPLIDTSNAETLVNTWTSCSGLVTFPAIDTSACTDFTGTWTGCTSITSWAGQIDVSQSKTLELTFGGCSSATPTSWTGGVTSTAHVENWTGTFKSCAFATVPAWVDTASATTMKETFNRNSSLTTMPALDITNVQTFEACWYLCTALNFPADFFNSWDPPSGPTSKCFTSTWITNTKSGHLSQQSVENILNSILASGVTTGSTYNIELAGAAGVTVANIQAALDGTTGNGTLPGLRTNGWQVRYRENGGNLITIN